MKFFGWLFGKRSEPIRTNEEDTPLNWTTDIKTFDVQEADDPLSDGERCPKLAPWGERCTKRLHHLDGCAAPRPFLSYHYTYEEGKQVRHIDIDDEGLASRLD